MFLKSLTLKGFKSFADSTVMALEPGVTVVVGPNGSGKSNVVDAIAWVLGAQAPKSVRSQKMDDVIFAGTDKRSALGRAEVTLTLDNSSGLLPVDFNEVTLTRILFRSGDSEYAINGVTCRLLDIQELLSDAGVGRQQHVIVSQGQIDAVLNARPEDRRGIIEEAAGVLKYRKRKEKAERRLDATEANLLRLQDLLREVRRQLRPLERQAEAARRHAEITEELTGLRVYVAGREIAALRAKLTTIATDREVAVASERDAKSVLVGLDRDIVDAEASLAAHGEGDVGDRLRRVEQLRERARGLAGIVAERRRSIERDRGQLLDAGVIANLEGDLARLRSELGEVVAGLDAVHPDTVALDTDEAQLRADREQMATLFAAESDGAQAASAAAEVRGELRSIRTSVEQLESAARSGDGRREALVARITELDAEATDLRARCARAETDEEVLVERLERAESDHDAATTALEAARTEHAGAVERVSRAEARAEALQQALDAVRARAGADRLADVDGVLGTLLEVVEVDERWMPAVEAALAEALTAIVVEGDGAARRALGALRETGTSGAVLVTRPGGRGAVPFADAGVDDGVIDDGVIADGVIADGVALRRHVASGVPGVEGVLDALLADVVCVPSFESGVEAALARPDLTIVTEAGDRFGRSGWRVGAAAGGATAAALADAEAAAAAAVEARDRTAAALRSAEGVSERTAAEVAGRARELDQHDGRFAAASERLARVLEQRRDAQTELSAVEANLSELGERLARERARLAELDEILPALDADEQAEADAARRRGEARAEFETRAAVIGSRRRELEVRTAGLHERRQFLDRRIAEIEQRLTADADARVHAAEQREQLERGLVALDRLGELLVTVGRSVDAEWSVLDERRRRQTDAVRALTARLDDARRRRGEAERALEESRQRHQKCEIDAAEARLRLETAVETLRRDLDVEPETAEAAPQPEVPEGATPAGRVRELDRELRLLGPINPLALEEFNELQQRHEFLEAQLEDVRSTRRDLHRVIKAVDAEIQNVFVGAFADVSTNFTQLFGTLFPGGAGHLKLTNPDDLLDTGIEVEAKPSGKNVKKLSLLSGGERSLTALAFLFAVFRSRPSPFYVMDEVEAALDDVNLHRFLGLVDEFRKDAQLVIVSHQKRTMEAGDSLLGVSMQPGGSSKVVTERASTATARTARTGG